MSRALPSGIAFEQFPKALTAKTILFIKHRKEPSQLPGSQTQPNRNNASRYDFVVPGPVEMPNPIMRAVIAAGAVASSLAASPHFGLRQVESCRWQLKIFSGRFGMV